MNASIRQSLAHLEVLPVERDLVALDKRNLYRHR